MKYENAEALAAEIRSRDTWDLDELAELCRLADMEEQWAEADGDSFESIAFAAAEKLGVEIA